MTNHQERDAWSSDAYQKAAAFVPKLATKVVQWLDVQPDDKILDIGCGDGVLTCQIAQSLTTGLIIGLDSSKSMIDSALELQQGLDPSHSRRCRFYTLDARDLHAQRAAALDLPPLDKVFSNAALHWILRDATRRDDVFRAAHAALRRGGSLVFEMGGHGNVAEMRAAIVSAVARRVGPEAAARADPWFFPDAAWMRAALERHGFVVESLELEPRPTPVQDGDGGGVEGWVRLMGSSFFDVVGDEGSLAREECIRDAVDRLEADCRSPDGGHVIGYVRLRALARKPL